MARDNAMNIYATVLAVVVIAGIWPVSVLAQSTAGSPIAINACSPMMNNNNTQTLFGVPVASTSTGIQIQFTNESSKSANLINFSVRSNGDSFVIRDVGTFFARGRDHAPVPQRPRSGVRSSTICRAEDYVSRAVCYVHRRHGLAARTGSSIQGAAASGKSAFNHARVRDHGSQRGVASLYGA